MDRMNCSLFRSIRYGYFRSMIDYCNTWGWKYFWFDTFGIKPKPKSESMIIDCTDSIPHPQTGSYKRHIRFLLWRDSGGICFKIGKEYGLGSCWENIWPTTRPWYITIPIFKKKPDRKGC